MIYLFYSLNQKSFLKREAKKIAKASLTEINDFNYALFDARETPLREIIDACLEVPMLESKKVVVVDNTYYFTGGKTKDKVNTEKDYDRLSQYLSHPSNETDLIFLVYSDKLDGRSKLTKLINEVAKVATIAPLRPLDWEKYVRQLLSNVNSSFTNEAIYELARRTLNDRDRLLNEIDKLSLYSDKVTLNDVITLVNEPLEERSFALSNALVENKPSEALYIYRDLLKQKNIDPISLLIMLANHFRLMFMVSYLHKQGKSVLEIAKDLHLNEFRAKILYQTGKKYEKKFGQILEDIHQIDFKIKSGQIDHFFALELFILNFNKKYQNL